jgi:hypothetical protein
MYSPVYVVSGHDGIQALQVNFLKRVNQLAAEFKA